MAKALLLTVSAGGGHNSAARAIAEALDDLKCDTMTVDTLKFVSPVLDRLVAGGYEKSAKYAPRAMGAIYHLSAGKSRKEDLDTLVRGIIGRKTFQLVQDISPDIIIGTHPFPVMSLVKYKEKGSINIPVISTVTDYTAHPAYIQKNIDAFIAGDTEVSYILKNAGIPEEKIYPFGIPVSRDFLKPVDADDVRRDLQIDNRFTVILVGGSFGAGSIKSSLLELLKSTYDFQIVVITGRDISLKSRLEKLVAELKPEKTVRVLGFTQNMSGILAAGNVLVTKPGGLTVTEAVIKGIPMIIPYYIPGQEEENIDYLLNNGLALKTSDKFPLRCIVEMLIDNPWRCEEIIQRMERRRRTDGARHTAELALQLIEKNKK